MDVRLLLYQVGVFNQEHFARYSNAQVVVFFTCSVHIVYKFLKEVFKGYILWRTSSTGQKHWYEQPDNEQHPYSFRYQRYPMGCTNSLRDTLLRN